MWHAWHPEPSISGGLVLLLGCYGWLFLRGMGDRLRGPWPAWRVGAFLLGVASIALALESPLDTLADVLVSAHMLQHTLLLMVAPPLLVAGVPATAALRALPGWLRNGLVRPLARGRRWRRLLRSLCHPATALGLAVLTLGAWALPACYAAALRDQTVHIVEHSSLLGLGTLLAWLTVEPLPAWPVRLAATKRFWCAAFQTPMLGLGCWLLVANVPLYPVLTEAIRATLAVTPVTDQRAGGAVMAGASLGMLLWIVAMPARSARRQVRHRAVEMAPRRAGVGGYTESP